MKGSLICARCIFSFVSLLIAAVLCTGCVFAIEHPELKDEISLSTKRPLEGVFEVMEFTADSTTWQPAKFREEISAALQANGMHANVEGAPHHSRKGLFVLVSGLALPPSKAAQFFHLLSIATLYALPSYEASTRWQINYDLYVDSELKKTYSYRFRFLEVRWVGLLPFKVAKMLFPPTGKNALATLTLQFLSDAHLDGYL